MLSKKIKISLTFALSFGIWLALDILTKQWAVSQHFEVTKIIGDWFYLTEFHKNDGIAFSIDVPRFLMIGGSFAMLAFLLIFGLKHIFELKGNKSSILSSIMLGLVVAGGIGNLIERISQGYVVDFIVLKPIPVFNLADVGITVGLIVLFVTMLIEESKNKKT